MYRVASVSIVSPLFPRWEVETSSKSGLHEEDSPACLGPLSAVPGIRTMHIFLADNRVDCPKQY